MARPAQQSDSPHPRLGLIDTYYDAVPRSSARAETIGPFTLFVSAGAGFPFYARPSLGIDAFTSEDVARVRQRQRELEVPETFEWVAEVTPALAGVLAGSGLSVERHPLMLLEQPTDVAVPTEVEIFLATEADDLALFRAVAQIGFGTPGTATGHAGILQARQAAQPDDPDLARQRQRLREGKTITAVALSRSGPVATGSHEPVDGVTELVGIAVLPAHRRRGIAAALTARLMEDARGRGIHTIFLSAGDEAIARIYARVGFRTIATACIAESTM